LIECFKLITGTMQSIVKSIKSFSLYLQDYLIRKLSEGPPELEQDLPPSRSNGVDRQRRRSSPYGGCPTTQRSSFVSSSSVSPRDSTTSAAYSSSEPELRRRD